MARVTIVPLGHGAYRVEHDEQQEIVYVAADSGTQWAFWNGHVFREAEPVAGAASAKAAAPAGRAVQAVGAPMPATVIKVLVTVGAAVNKGDTLLVLEAMKMELPVRAPADATVTAVNCREGDLVQPDQALVDLEVRPTT